MKQIYSFLILFIVSLSYGQVVNPGTTNANVVSNSAPNITCIDDQTISTAEGVSTYTHGDRNWDPEVTNVPTPGYLNTSNWSSTASRGSTSIDEVQVFGEERLRLAYNGNGLPRNGTYSFSTTADMTGNISFDWFLQGCHSFFMSNANFRLWVGNTSNIVETLYNGGGCSFSNSGNSTISLTAGQQWGIIVTGDHFDGSNLLNGRLEIFNFISREYTLSGATTGTGTSLNGVEFNLGTTKVSWIAEDKDGITSTCSFNITVEDNEAPNITCPEEINTTATSPVVNFNNPTLTDNETTAFPFVSLDMTYIGSNGGKNFFISEQSFSGANAFADAIARGGFVATISDATQNTFIANALQANNITEAHIGYSDAASEGNFVWQDGSTSTYENWQPNEPNDTDGGEDYVTISAGGGWNDVGARGTGNARYIFQLDQTDGFLIQTSGLASGSSFPIGTTTNTFEAYDASGNSASCSFDVTVTDIPEVVTQNIDVVLDATGNATITPEEIDNGSTAASGILGLSLDILNFDCSNLGENTVTLTVISNTVETATGTAIVTVSDTTAPTVVTQNITVELDASGEAIITADQIDNGSADNCGIDNLALDVSQFNCSNIGENTVTLTVTDASGNQASETAVVTVTDTTAPTVVTQDITVELDANGEAAITADQIDNGTSDNCSSISGDCIDGMTYGNAEIFIEGAGMGRVDFSAGLVSASSGGVPMELVPITTIDSKVRSGDLVHARSTLSNGSRPSGESIFFRTSDNRIIWGGHSPSGTFANRTRLIIEQENVAAGELIDFSKPYNLRFQLNGRYLSQSGGSFTSVSSPADISAVLISGDLGATNNCLLTTSLDATTFDCSNLGENTVTLTATDGSGNSSSATAIVTVIDNLSPAMVTQDLTVELNANGEATITAAQVDNGSADNCGVDTLALDITTFDCSNLGENTVTLTATDASGNQATATATVTVVDNSLPTAVAQNLTVDLDEFGAASITAAQVDNGSSDNCGVETLALDVTSFDCSNLGENTVSLTATDASGNQAAATAVITVIDAMAPALVTADITVSLDDNATVSIEPGDLVDTLEDNCSLAGEITLALDQDTFTATGVYVVNLTATDASGNTTTVSAEVTVDSTLRIDQVDPDIQVKLYPNPTSDHLFFEVSNTELIHITIYDMNGKLVKTSQESHSVDVTNLSSGVYFAKVDAKGGNTLKILRFIKK